jgi:hypothetical protein
VAYPIKRTLADKILIQLIEAEVESGFALVDDAKAYRSSGQAGLSWRALQDAEEVVEDIEFRLKQLGDSQSEPFHPLVTELRDEIAAAERGLP